MKVSNTAFSSQLNLTTAAVSMSYLVSRCVFSGCYTEASGGAIALVKPESKCSVSLSSFYECGSLINGGAIFVNVNLFNAERLCFRRCFSPDGACIASSSHLNPKIHLYAISANECQDNTDTAGKSGILLNNSSVVIRSYNGSNSINRNTNGICVGLFLTTAMDTKFFNAINLVCANVYDSYQTTGQQTLECFNFVNVTKRTSILYCFYIAGTMTARNFYFKDVNGSMFGRSAHSNGFLTLYDSYYEENLGAETYITSHNLQILQNEQPFAMNLYRTSLCPANLPGIPYETAVFSSMKLPSHEAPVFTMFFFSLLV